ncbi:DNA-directed RNA polymerase I subunit RPA43-like [Pholidichthys leucotaenia]
MANLKHVEDNPKQMRMHGEVLVRAASDQQIEKSLALGKELVSVPSFAATSELLSTPYSCLVTSTHQRHVALPPRYLNKRRTGIKQELEGELLKFSRGLNGISLAYDDIKVVGHCGDIYDDSGYIHLDIEVKYIVFQPKKGQRLLGKVNKLGVSHVGCVVHGCFNATISRPQLVSVETWRDAGPRMGAELEFDVAALDADPVGVLLIRGLLDETRVQELVAIGETTGSSVPTDQQGSQELFNQQKPGPSQEATDDTPKKKKKKREVENKGETEEELINMASWQQDSNAAPELTRQIDETNGSDRKKKKKEKLKLVKEEVEEIKISHMEVHGSDSSGYISDKPNKKRKRQSGNNSTSSFSKEFEPIKFKKLKNDIEQFT